MKNLVLLFALTAAVSSVHATKTVEIEPNLETPQFDTSKLEVDLILTAKEKDILYNRVVGFATGVLSILAYNRYNMYRAHSASLTLPVTSLANPTTVQITR